MIISADQQIPFEDKRALGLYFKVLKSFKPDWVLLAGDEVDFPEYGRWTAGGTQEFINTLPSPEIGDKMLKAVFDNAKAGSQFYARQRELAPQARIVNTIGNHNIRIWTYFDQKAPELLPHLTPNALWGLDDLGIEHHHYQERPTHLFGGVYMHHGVAISKHAGESVRADMENFGVSLIRGHSHRQAIINRRYELLNETRVGIELGHLMDVNCSGASYDNVHNWNLGFAIGFVEDGAATPDGLRFHPQLVPISSDYTCVVGGRLYRG